ncbi:outer membrane lipoprotein-sorting protein [Candidatus Bipolaricaulota bacterium]|nr:outer membrane lipoprotein-sorting protein [Candidatus Bipolaricaulota bacterium]
MRRVVVAATMAAIVGVTWSGIARAFTADEILARVEEQSFFGTGRGSLYVALAVGIEEKNQPPSRYAFRVWAKEYPDGTTKTLLLYAAPELVAGTMYLAHIPKEGPERMWLWLPDLEVLKELVSESERKGEFIAGSGISYDDVASGFSYREGYDATVAGEETVAGHIAWRLDLTPTEPTAEWSRIVLWVHQEEFIVLRAEFYDRAGKQDRVLTVPELVEDEIGLRPAQLVVESPLQGSRATVEIEVRSEAEIPDGYFEPENLGKLEL